MEQKSPVKDQILDFVKSVLLWELAIFALVALGGWIRGWLTWGNYGRALQWAGLGVIALGGIGILGNWGSTQRARFEELTKNDTKKQPESYLSRTKEWFQDYKFVFLMAAVGLIAMGVGAIIQTQFQ